MEQLLPLFLSLLKDEWPDLRLAIIGKLQAVNQVGGGWVELGGAGLGASGAVHLCYVSTASLLSG